MIIRVEVLFAIGDNGVDIRFKCHSNGLDEMDLRQRLKEETKHLHDEIEQAFLLKKIILQQITLNEYSLLIEKFYGFIAPCEDLINSLACKSALQQREKKPWLKLDLQVLTNANFFDANLSECIDLPFLTEYEHVLGYLYVMEGATLGGQIITKMLNIHLQITPNHGGKFFHAYGDKTKLMWNEFCLSLCNIHDINQQNKIINSARDTFKKLYQWMENKGNKSNG